MSRPPCTRFDDFRRAAATSPQAAADWRRHRETCTDCRTHERVDAALRASLPGVPEPGPSGTFTARVVARLATAPAPRRRRAWGLPILLAYAGLALATSAFILARLPAPGFLADAGRAIVLGGALLSPLVLLGVVRRSLLQLAGRC